MTDLHDAPVLAPRTASRVRPPADGSARTPGPVVPPLDAADLVQLTTPGRRTTPTERGTAARRARLPLGVERLAGVVLLFAAWEVAAQLGWISPRVLAGPSTVGTVGLDLLRDGSLVDSLWASLQRVLWGLGLGIPIGTGLALVSGLFRVGDDLIDANVQMLRFVPIIALQPLLVVWLGVGETVKISMIVLGVAFPIYVNTSAAIKGLDPRYRELATVVGLSRSELIRRVVLPGALPGFTVGLRLATAVAWLILVFAEQINATSGIGYLMARAQVFFQTDVIVVGLVTYAVLGLLSDGLVRWVERRLLRWQPGR